MSTTNKRLFYMIFSGILLASIVPVCQASHDADSPPGESLLNTGSAKQGSEQANMLWTTQNGESLQGTVYRWSRSAGYEVVWDAPYDYPVLASIVLSGSYESALTSLFSAYSVSERPLKVDVFRAQKLIHIEPY